MSRKTVGALMVASYLMAGRLAANSAGKSTEVSTENTALSLAVCPIAYPLDENPAQRGVHYIFYGNGFFINRQGYLLTAAHVLSQLNQGGQPFVLLRSKHAPPRLVKAEVIGVDTEHDVAILRVTPNPFAGKYFDVGVLQLTTEKPVRGRQVSAEALRPSRLKDPHSFDAPVEEKAAGEVLDYTTSELERGKGKSELFLFNHEILRGQSGAPVLMSDSGQVVGLVEGRWLHPGSVLGAGAAMPQSSTLGAAVPIHYAIELLEQKGIAWEKSAASE